MLARTGSMMSYCPGNEMVIELFCALEFGWTARIDQIPKMEVTVTDVSH